MGSASNCVGGHDRLKRFSGFCSLGRRGFSLLLCWRARQVMALLWPLFTLVGVGSDSHCGGWHDRWGRCSGICSLVLCELSQSLC